MVYCWRWSKFGLKFVEKIHLQGTGIFRRKVYSPGLSLWMIFCVSLSNQVNIRLLFNISICEKYYRTHAWMYPCWCSVCNIISTQLKEAQPTPKFCMNWKICPISSSPTCKTKVWTCNWIRTLTHSQAPLKFFYPWPSFWFIFLYSAIYFIQFLLFLTFMYSQYLHTVQIIFSYV